ncbi:MULTISPECIES: hypothetical protein [unclassified Phyllobacterium]|uniref:hypothetical protein n=1 Tax=unclassified Phyllobacterium TaxID=2638441 RepID=UPI003012BA82
MPSVKGEIGEAAGIPEAGCNGRGAVERIGLVAISLPIRDLVTHWKARPIVHPCKEAPEPARREECHREGIIIELASARFMASLFWKAGSISPALFPNLGVADKCPAITAVEKQATVRNNDAIHRAGRSDVNAAKGHCFRQPDAKFGPLIIGIPGEKRSPRRCGPSYRLLIGRYVPIVKRSDQGRGHFQAP